MRNGLFIILCFIWLADMTAMVALAPLGEHPVWFSGLYSIGHILMVALVRKFPPNLSPRASLAVIFIIGVVARLILLWYPPGNDVFRYVWEGYIQTMGFNPYHFAPDHPALLDVARGEIYPIWQQINHPEFSAAYPALTLLLFKLFARLSPTPFFFNTVMIAFDLGVMIILMLMISRLAFKPSRLLLYAANPLVLLYIAGEGHLDVIQAFFLCLALYFIICQNHLFSGFVVLGLAIVSKYFALPALPFVLNAENRLKSLAVFIPLILYIPFWDAGTGLFQSIGLFASHYHYNDSLAMLIRLIFNDFHLFATGFFLIAGLVWVYLLVHDPLRSVYLAMGCLLLFLPTLQPWYLVLIAPFLVFFPSRAWLYLQAAVVFTFPVIAIEWESGIFQEIIWLKWFEYVPFYALLIWGLKHDGYILRDRFYPKPKSISVIIPTLNEAYCIGRCIDSLINRHAVKEIIVTDGGSTDKTLGIAVKMGAQVVQSQAGRGIQIEQGLRSASGDVIIVVHADCVANGEIFARVIQKLETSPDAVGGAFGMHFESKNLKTRTIAVLNHVRTRLTGISFGDQAQFFRAEALDDIGGFPAFMLMEDVELSLRLKEVGRLVLLPRGIQVSARRWQGRRFSNNLMMVLRLFFQYLIEKRFYRADRFNRKYYEIYYDKTEKLKPN